MNLADVERVTLDAFEDGGNLLQTGFWGEFKSGFGWTPVPLSLRLDDGSAVPCLVLERPIHGPFTFAYIPHGPDLPERAREGRVLSAIARAVRRSLSPMCVFLRFDVPWEIVDPLARERVFAKPLVKARTDTQVPDTVVIDLEPGEQAVLDAMKTKTRYNIRLSARKGVCVDILGSEAIGRWYRLYRETARRDRIAIHSESYYRSFIELAERSERTGADRPVARILLARYEGRDLAGIIVALNGDTATYLYGASSDEYRNLMPAYAAQWGGITFAREHGCSVYDLFGIAPGPDPSHPLYGLYRVKTGFGGRIVHRPGSWDYPYRPVLYSTVRLAEWGRDWYYKRVRKGIGRSSPG